MTNIVLDTNIIISAALSPNGNPAKILSLTANENDMQIYYAMEILEEYKEVLSRPRMNIDAKTQICILNAITKTGILIVPSPSNIPMLDETDRIFYDTAKASNSILITGNTKHYPVEPFIMTPTEFLNEKRDT